jgi:hypothetical protein
MGSQRQGFNKSGRRASRRLRPTKLINALGTIRVPIKVQGDRKQFDQNILWPHKLFAAMYEGNVSEFIVRCCGGAVGNIKEFWTAQKDHPSFADHPMHNHPRFCYETHGVPISLHGDGTNVLSVGKKGAKHLDAISWNPVLSNSGVASLVNFFIVLVFQLTQLTKDGFDTMDTVWMHITWSLYWLYQGVHPDRNHFNVLYTEADGDLYIKRLTPLAGGFFGVLFFVRADLDFSQSHSISPNTI